MRVTVKGQVTIPLEVREKLGIFPGSEVNFVIRNNSVTLEKSKTNGGKKSRGKEIVDRMVGSGTAKVKMSTDEIMALTRGWDEEDSNR